MPSTEFLILLFVPSLVPSSTASNDDFCALAFLSRVSVACETKWYSMSGLSHSVHEGRALAGCRQF